MRSISERPSWDRYFVDVAATIASRSSCSRASVGAVFVRDYRVLARGYNGAVAGAAHCEHEHGDLDANGSCAVAIHAEQNAIYAAARFGVSLSDSTLYVTHRPCYACARAVASVGCREVVYANDYRPDARASSVLRTAQIVERAVELDSVVGSNGGYGED